MRKTLFVPGEYYHIFNRGNNKQIIFRDNRDWARFLFALLYFQSDTPIYNLGPKISYFIKHRVFNISRKMTENIVKNRSVELINFCLMPNHFHATVKELKENGISNYMQRVLNAFTKYFNTKHEQSGHLFQGPFKAVHIENNEQLLYLSAYIHSNPKGIQEWKNKIHQFPWSSFQDYVMKNRWGNLLQQNIILDQISFGKEYQNLVKQSGAKDMKEFIDNATLID